MKSEPRPRSRFVFYKNPRDAGELRGGVIMPGPWSLGGFRGKSGRSRQQKHCFQGVPVLWCLCLEQTNKKPSSARLPSLLIQRWLYRSLPFSISVPIRGVALPAQAWGKAGDRSPRAGGRRAPAPWVLGAFVQGGPATSLVQAVARFLICFLKSESQLV